LPFSLYASHFVILIFSAVAVQKKIRTQRPLILLVYSLNFKLSDNLNHSNQLTITTSNLEQGGSSSVRYKKYKICTSPCWTNLIAFYDEITG